MRLSYVPQILNKKERQSIVVVGDSFIEQSAECWLKQNFNTPTDGLACVVNGKIVNWSHIPAKDDDVIFVQKLGETTFWTIVIVMVVSMVMSIVMSMLFAPDMPGQQNEDSDTYGWDGIKNIIGEGNVMPVVYGRHAIGGIIIEGYINGNIESGIQKRKYLNALIALSEGEIHEIETDTIKINQTELSEFANDAQIWTKTGEINQTPIDAFSEIARHISISGNVKVTKASGGYVYKTTGACNKITVNTQFQSLFHANNKGGLDNISVNVSLLYAHESDKNNWHPLTNTIATAKSKSAVEHQITGEFPTKGVYYVKIKRETGDFTSPKDSGDMFLRAVTEYENAKLAYPSTALLGVKLTATDKLSGSMPSISVTVKGRKVKDVRNPSNPALVEHMGNPANVIYDLLTNDLYGLGKHVKPEQIDIESFQDFANWCDELVTFKKWNSFFGVWDEYQQKRYVFNLVLDKPDKASDVITKIAASCRSKIYWSGSKVRVVTDKPVGGAYAQIFSMSNIVADSFEETYVGIAEVPGQVEVQILDEEDDFKRATIVAVDKSRLENTTSKTINMYGITDKARAKREALFSMKYMVATRKKVKFASSVQAIICEVGDVILFQHDVPQYGFGGHIVGKSGNQVTLNTAVPIESGKSYRLRIRKQDNSYVLYTIVASATTQTINLDCGMVVDSGIEPGNIFQFGEILQDGTTLDAKPFRVVGITKGEEYKVVLDCEEYNESIFDEDDTIEIKDVNYSALGVAAKYQVDGLITDPDLRSPEFIENPVVNQNTGEIPPFVTDVTIEEELILVGNVYKPTIAVWFSPVYMPENSLAYITKYVVTYSKDGGASWVNAGVATGNFFRISDVEVGETYYVLVKPVTNYFVTNQIENSIHELSNYITVMGKVAPPSAPTGLTATPGTFLCDLQWPAIPDSDYRHMEIWCASGANNRTNAVLVGTSTGTRFKHTGVYQDTTYYYWIRAVDTTGNIGEFYPTSGIGGVQCTPANDPSKVLDLLQGSITESQLSAELQAVINSESGIQAVEELLENQWTVKINEDGHVAGVGIIMYPNWDAAATYAASFAVEAANGLFYKSLQANNTNHEPPVSPTWWAEIPYGTKSEFLVVADKFAVINPATPTQPAKVPFVVGTVNGTTAVGIDGDMVVDGTIGADKIITDELIVGDNIQMGPNALISWSKVTSQPTINKSFSSASGVAPTGMVAGDLWYQTDTLLLKRYDGSTWQNAGSLGAPTGTNVAGTSAATVVSNASNGATAFTGTAAYRNTSAPSNNGVFGTITTGVASADGNVIVTVPYTYTQGTVKADQLFIFVRDGGGTVVAADPAWATNAVSGAISFTLKPSTSYTFGIQAVRRVEAGLTGTSITTSSSITTIAGNYTGNVSGVAAGTVVSNASTALQAVNDAASDTILTPLEKQAAKIEFDSLAQEVSSLGLQATALGITTEKTNYDTAYNTLNAYISPFFSSMGANSTIVSATYLANWKGYYDKRAILQAKMTEVAATKSTWDGVSSKPELVKGDGTTTLGSNFIYTGTLSANQVNASNFTAQTANIADAAINSAKIADLAVQTGHIGDLQVDTLKIANNAVTVPVASFISNSVQSNLVSPSTWYDTGIECTVAAPVGTTIFVHAVALHSNDRTGVLPSEKGYASLGVGRVLMDGNSVVGGEELRLFSRVFDSYSSTYSYPPMVGAFMFKAVSTQEVTTFKIQVKAYFGATSTYCCTYWEKIGIVAMAAKK